MSDKFDQYTDAISRLAGEMVNCSPESWNGGRLSIQGGRRITAHFGNPDSLDRAVVSAELGTLINELYMRMRDGGDRWSAAEFIWWHDTDGLAYNIDFTYEEPGAAEAKRPWWKFGLG